MSTESLVFHRTDDGTLVAPPRCGLLTVPDFLAQVQRCASDGDVVLVDLSQVATFDTAAFRSLVWARRFCATRGVRFGVVGPPPSVLRPQEEAILRDLLPVYPDRASARRPGSGEAPADVPGQRYHSAQGVQPG
jgi:anti-anti-sigma regulatory factor